MSAPSFVRRASLAAIALVTLWTLVATAQPTAQRPPAVHDEGAAHASAEPEAETPGPINWFDFGAKTPPFIANVVNFAILALGIYYLGRKGVGESLRRRRDTVAKDIEDAQAMKREAEARAETYRAKLERVEEEVRATRELLVHSGEAERERMVHDAETKADRMRKEAEFMVEQELDQLRKALWREAVDAAVAAAETLLKERITAADHARLADDFLSDLGSRPAPLTSEPAPRAVYEGAQHEAAQGEVAS